MQAFHAGKFGIVFQHDALNALGIEAPLRAFELGTVVAVWTRR